MPLDEAICGYAGRYYSVESKGVKQGLSVEMLAGEISAGQVVPLRFRVNQKPRDMPVDDLQVEHEKLMHVIGVREDLGEFFHIHPRRAGPGMWEIIHTFTNGGRYQVWVDVKQLGAVYSFAEPRITVSGRINSVEHEPVPKLQDSRAGYQITLMPSVWRTTGCESHFIVWRNQVWWCEFGSDDDRDTPVVAEESWPLEMEDELKSEWRRLARRPRPPRK